LLANVALSELDEHFARAWQAMDTTGNQRLRRRATGLATYRLVRFADLCRGRHKSAYAEVRVMPTCPEDALVGGLIGVAGSA
jgi:hypothetical protein